MKATLPTRYHSHKYLYAVSQGSLPFLFPQWITQIASFSLFFSHSMLCFRPQLQQATPGSLQTPLNREAKLLTADFLLSFPSSESNPPVSALALQKTSSSVLHPSFLQNLFPSPNGSHRSSPTNFLAPTQWFIPVPYSMTFPGNLQA